MRTHTGEKPYKQGVTLSAKQPSVLSEDRWEPTLERNDTNWVSALVLSSYKVTDCPRISDKVVNQKTDENPHWRETIVKREGEITFFLINVSRVLLDYKLKQFVETYKHYWTV